MLEISYHPKASHEAKKSARFYNHKRPGLGMEFFDQLEATVQKLQAYPLRSAADPNGIRSRRLHRFPFRVYYVIDPERIRILAVAHLRRKPGYWRHRITQ